MESRSPISLRIGIWPYVSYSTVTGGLVRDIENEHTCGTNSYPETLTSAYDYLVNYKAACTSNNNADKGGLNFYADHDQQDQGCRRGDGGSIRGGRGGCGRGSRGQHQQGHGGHGCGRGGQQNQGGNQAGTDKPTSGAEDNDAQFLLDNADNLEENED
mmetsp:Transcript_7775/g.11227  ORF Transcript_7775/g.11227 Transcript_7775/m.11227 type:complete len:158 (+) Transcript_7775:288-761(+)